MVQDPARRRDGSAVGTISRIVTVGLLALALFAGSGTAKTPRLPPELAAWPRGPVRWLLLPDEADAFADLTSADEARAFIQHFWERRDPSPGSPVNVAAQQFFDRVEMADKLYLEEDRPGSLTERGGVLILLGSPAILRVQRRHTPALDVSKPGRAGDVQQIPIEIWGYRPADLPDLVRLDPTLGEQKEITITFQLGREHSSILDGRGLLRLAARAAVQRP